MSTPERKPMASIEDLRKRAEEKLKEQEKSLWQTAPKDIKELVHELGTYQIELEMQNEELRRAQEELHESRREYSDLYDFAPVGYLLLNRGGYINKMNLTASSMLRVERGRKHFFSSYVVTEDKARFREHLLSVFTARDTKTVEIKMKRHDGTEFIAQLKSSPAIEDGETYLRTIVSDVSEIREAETARKRAEEQESEAREESEHLRTQRLDSLNVMVGGIAHDLNNLMVAVEANAGLALKELDPSSPAWEAIKGVERAVGKVSNLARQILSFSGKTRNATMEPVDVNAMTEDTTHLLLATISPDAAVESRYCQDLPLVLADPQNVQQVLMNLIINASDAVGGKNGIIRICTGATDASREYLDGLFMGKEAREGKYVYVEVQDNGIGMSEDTVDRIFEPFFTTKFTGRGLGLPAVLNIVKFHGGAIDVDTSPGKGTSFKVLFPVPEVKLEVKEDKKPAGDVWKGKGTVLVVDDDADSLLMTKKILAMAGYKVLSATDGLKAISVFEKHKDEIALVVMDYIMPQMRGNGAGAHMRSIKEEVNIIFLSGYYDIDLHEVKVCHGEDCPGKTVVIEKPYKIDQFLQKVQETAKPEH